MKEIEVQAVDRNTIVEYVVKSEVINRAIRNICPKDQLYEFVPFFHSEICSIKYEKLLKAYNEGYIDWLCIKVITNHINSNTSKFHYLYRKNNNASKGFEEEEHVQLMDRLTDLEDEYDVEADQKNERRMALVQEASRKLDWYSKTLWDMYFVERLTCAEISRSTGINYNSVYHNLAKSKKTIKGLVLEVEEGPKKTKQPSFKLFISKTKKQ